jgi:hypothetical protein
MAIAGRFASFLGIIRCRRVRFPQNAQSVPPDGRVRSIASILFDYGLDPARQLFDFAAADPDRTVILLQGCCSIQVYPDLTISCLSSVALVATESDSSTG